MWVTINGTNSTEIEDSVVERVLNLYPEEKLVERPVFQRAFADGVIELQGLREESDKILIPWQMFLLSTTNLTAAINHIELQRQHKVSKKLVAKRKGIGEVTSKRIIDRLIRQQNYLTSTSTLTTNTFCGSLKGLRLQTAVAHILSHFEIDREGFWKYSGKGSALEYLIRQVDRKSINVSRGVLTNKILPNHQVVGNEVYKNTSGFAIRDERVPFIFLPSEVNPDEVESRQIYTLVYLLVVIGLDQYDYVLEKNFKATLMKAQKMSARIHTITSELLMPTVETEKLRGQKITPSKRDQLSSKFKVSPLALVITLRMRGILTKKEYEALKPPPFTTKKARGQARSPHISTSVSKFCGSNSFQAINNGIRLGTLPSTQAQYLIFGAVNKKGFRKYRNELSI
ncbi:MAG: hypothetical protein KBC62_02385 [Candidatus Pacebacteria bacterium]|nr:hypothetical protein [Candidatus Paceibacterota bacterium]